MKSIQVANLDDAVMRMGEAKDRNDEDMFFEARESLRSTLDAIKNVDQQTHSKYEKYKDMELS